MKKPILFVLFFAIAAQISFAQFDKAVSNNPRVQLKIADRLYAESAFYSALEYYKDVVRQEPENRYATYWLAVSCLMARDYANAEVFFTKFYGMKPGKKDKVKNWEKENAEMYGMGDFYYGQVLHRNGKYDEAVTRLNRFINSYAPKDETDQLKQWAELELKGCEFAKASAKAKVKVKSLGSAVNKSYTEASPFALNKKTLLYSSLKIDAGSDKVDTLIFYTSPKSKRVYQIYMSKQGEDGAWSKGQAVANTDINEEGFSVGNGTFNRDRTRFYFTKCLERDDERSLCNIFVSAFSNGNFSAPERIAEPINTKDGATATQPTVRSTADGYDIIYYVSDMEGGKGGLDIWYFLRTKGGDYKGPKLLKGPINTPGDELTPFYDDSTGQLFFSSNGHPGMGGYDVFASHENADLGWSDPENLGRGINTGADELYYTRSTEQTHGYLVTNREGSVPLNGIKTASDDIFGWENFKFAVEGTVFKDGEEGGTLTGAKFKLYKKNFDGTKELVSIDSSARAQSSGAYFFKMAPETDYLVEVERPGFQSKLQDVTTKGLPDEDTIQQNILVKKGVYIGFGRVSEEGKDVSVDGAFVTIVEMSPSGMEKQIGMVRTDASGMYFSDLEANKDYKINVRREGYFAVNKNLSTKNLGNVDSVRADVSIKKLELNVEYTLQNVLYEFGKATLTEGSKAVMDILYGLMSENPTFVVELSAHTDAIGSDAANQKLSQARAESCVNYLIGRGIAKDRLVPVGYGETRPKVPNTKDDGSDDAAGRAVNRRTEFKILKQ